MDRKHFSPQTGLVPLRKGDDWLLEGKVVEAYAGYKTEVDLSDAAGASAFFPAASGGSFPGVAAVVDPTCGRIRLSVVPASSAEAQESPEGISPFLILNLRGQLITVETREPVLEILARGHAQG